MFTDISRRSRRLQTIGAVLALIVMLTSPPAEKAALAESIIVGYPTLSATLLPFMMADQTGLFKGEGLDVKMVWIRGEPIVVQALVAGDIDVAFVAFEGILGAAAGGGQIKYLAELLGSIPYYLVTAPSIKSYADLKGKAVGGAGPGSFADNLMLEALRKRGGLDPKKDVRYVNISGSTGRFTALISGVVVATILNPPSIQKANQSGFPTLDFIGDALGESGGQGVVTSRSKLSEKPEVLGQFVRASLKGIEAAKRKPQGAIGLYQEFLKLDAKTAGDVYKMMMERFRIDGRWSDAGLTNSINYFVRNKSKNPGRLADLVDPRFLP